MRKSAFLVSISLFLVGKSDFLVSILLFLVRKSDFLVSGITEPEGMSPRRVPPVEVPLTAIARAVSVRSPACFISAVAFINLAANIHQEQSLSPGEFDKVPADVLHKIIVPNLLEA